jgi:hypothetical protein
MIPRGPQKDHRENGRSTPSPLAVPPVRSTGAVTGLAQDSPVPIIPCPSSPHTSEGVSVCL